MTDKRDNPAASPRGSELASDFTVSLHHDRRLYREELAVSTAHVRMLAKQKIVDAQKADEIVAALAQIGDEIERGDFGWRTELEDIHMNIEARLHELLGEVAGLLHTGRSRNDLVATDTRLYTMRVCKTAKERLHALRRAIVEVAEAHTETLLPAYTHLQRGQPLTLGHYLLACYEMFTRDSARFGAAYDQADELPLGAGAMTGSPYDLDREFVARELGFSRVARNSVDAVSDRDYIAQFVFGAALCMTHLSRLAGELVLWSSAEFGFVKMAGEYTTGSSIMPQKRNPDFAELVRGRAGRSYGALINLLTTLKGLPLGYNRDMQEDKTALFDAADVVLPCLEATSGMVRTLTVNVPQMRAALDETSVLATDMADYLVRKGLPFRAAYVAVRTLSEKCRNERRELSQLALEEFKAVSPLFGADVKQLTVENSVKARKLSGGTAPERVRARIKQAKTELADG